MKQAASYSICSVHNKIHVNSGEDGEAFLHVQSNSSSETLGVCVHSLLPPVHSSFLGQLQVNVLIHMCLYPLTEKEHLRRDTDSPWETEHNYVVFIAARKIEAINKNYRNHLNKQSTDEGQKICTLKILDEKPTYQSSAG